MKQKLKAKFVIFHWRPVATTDVLVTTTDVLLATTDSFVTTTGDHRRPLATIKRFFDFVLKFQISNTFFTGDIWTS
jgi:hypothetical protein